MCGGWLGSPAKETWTIFLLPCKTTFLKSPHSPFNYHWNGVKWRISICTNFLIFILHLGISLWSHYTHSPTHLRTGLLGTLWAWGWVVFIRLFVAYLGRHPSSQEMQTSLERMAVLSKSQRKKKKKTKMEVACDFPHWLGANHRNFCRRWFAWKQMPGVELMVNTSSRQTEWHAVRPPGVGKNVSFGNRIHLGARGWPCWTLTVDNGEEDPGKVKYFWRGRSWKAGSWTAQQKWPRWMEPS